jgi:hypothetical protein
MQHHEFHDGTFVIHKVMHNGHKYSVWFSKDGIAHTAERFSKDNQRTYNVPLSQVNVFATFDKIGQHYKK